MNDEKPTPKRRKRGSVAAVPTEEGDGEEETGSRTEKAKPHTEERDVLKTLHTVAVGKLKEMAVQRRQREREGWGGGSAHVVWGSGEDPYDEHNASDAEFKTCSLLPLRGENGARLVTELRGERELDAVLRDHFSGDSKREPITGESVPGWGIWKQPFIVPLTVAPNGEVFAYLRANGTAHHSHNNGRFCQRP